MPIKYIVTCEVCGCEYPDPTKDCPDCAERSRLEASFQPTGPLCFVESGYEIPLNDY